ncbi:TIGR01244 family phosphatase [Martelella alba]|uniref:TIGR01244 family phosphatase n=1 Tax=Martelella alba TaxID=2590451 RepID=A0A506U9I3_9HYPH|nr:TIGR01244 family sulfur transferase [Martelella alba]TPW29751.1 TIGR01244 family phosphatase [Martelella alba]
MDIRKIDDDYSVSGQITVADIEMLKSLGFRSIVCNRPDAEEPGQPAFADVAAAAEAAGIEIAHVPVGGMGLTEQAVIGMVDALDELPRPMLGYCRSGARSTRIYEAAEHMRG